jgi:imidazolonepropionase-like amidohydrolase
MPEEYYPTPCGVTAYLGRHHKRLPTREVLRMATLTSAQVMGVTKDHGVLAAGKMADMVLIDGDPAKNIRDIRNITTVIKGGKVYDPAAIEKALGIAPRPAGR